MIKVQMNVTIHCDNPECDSDEHFTAYLPLDSTEEEIISEFIYQKRYTSWWYSRDAKKLFCNPYCGEAENYER